MSHDLGMKSRVHPKYKTKYRVGNWAEYDQRCHFAKRRASYGRYCL